MQHGVQQQAQRRVGDVLSRTPRPERVLDVVSDAVQGVGDLRFTADLFEHVEHDARHEVVRFAGGMQHPIAVAQADTQRVDETPVHAVVERLGRLVVDGQPRCGERNGSVADGQLVGAVFGARFGADGSKRCRSLSFTCAHRSATSAAHARSSSTLNARW